MNLHLLITMAAATTPTVISDSQVLEDFPVTPTKMTKEIHMIELMYAPKDYLVFIAMLPYIKLEMDHVTRQGDNFTTKSAKA